MSTQQIWQQRQYMQELPLYSFAHSLSLQTPETSLAEKKPLSEKFQNKNSVYVLNPACNWVLCRQLTLSSSPDRNHTLYMLHAGQSFGSCLTYQIKSHRIPVTVCHDDLKAHESRCWKFRCVQREPRVLPLNGTKVKVLKRKEKQQHLRKS